MPAIMNATPARVKPRHEKYPYMSAPRFDRPTREQIAEAYGRKIPDVIAPQLKVLFCGINPGLYSAAVGHHFGRPGNRFWPALHAAGFTATLMHPRDQRALLPLGCGITNLVARATATADELTADELVAGARRLQRKVRRHRPAWVAFLGMTAYRIAFARKAAVLGAQTEMLGGASLWVLPNPSGLNAHFQLGGLARSSPNCARRSAESCVPGLARQARPTIRSMAAPLLEVHDLRKRYGKHVALDGVSFAVAAGEMFGLLGPNGAGKTTLMSILAGLREPTDGHVRLQGQRLTRAARDLRRLIGIVPQDLAIYNELTARENLRFFGQLYGLGGRALEQRVEEVLAAVALADRADDRAGTFSGGMKRRLNLGAALVHGPVLLLLDEPTTGVDPQSRNHIFEEVRRLNNAGLTIIYTSHYMEEVQALCPRLGIIDHGRLVACDALATLLRQLPGLLRLRVAAMPTLVRDRLAKLPGVRPTGDERLIELGCQDVKRTLLDMIPLLAEEGVELTGIETEEPNLERVFLHLTGRACAIELHAAGLEDSPRGVGIYCSTALISFTSVASFVRPSIRRFG